jgi:hypothetical protein
MIFEITTVDPIAIFMKPPLFQENTNPREVGKIPRGSPA